MSSAAYAVFTPLKGGLATTWIMLSIPAECVMTKRRNPPACGWRQGGLSMHEGAGPPDHAGGTI